VATVELVSIEKTAWAEAAAVGDEPSVAVKLLIRFPGVAGSTPQGVPLSLTVPDQGDAARTLEAAREKLLALAEALVAAAKKPLW
jgi:hypothetical protein